MQLLRYHYLYMDTNYWDLFPTWQEAEKNWDEQAKEAEKIAPIRSLKVLHKIPGIE